MLRSICTLTFLVLIVTVPAWAQNPAAKTEPIAPVIGVAVEKPAAKPLTDAVAVMPSELKATPEMWFYEQYMHNYQDPKMAVRANAEFRATQRQRRLAAMQWFGFSNSRPSVSSDPFNGDWSPGWSSNNSSYPFRWNGVGPTWYVARPERATVYSY